MKRKVMAILIVVLGVLISGCAKNYYKDYEDTTNQIQDVVEEAITDTQIQYLTSTMVDNGSTFFFFVPTEDEEGAVMYCYEPSMEEAAALCSKAECRHDSEKCDGYYANRECLNYELWYQNGRIYRIEADENENKTYLVSSAEDGTDRHRDALLWEGEMLSCFGTWMKQSILHQGYFYYQIAEGHGCDIDIYKVSVNGGEREFIGAIPGKRDGVDTLWGSMAYGDGNIYYSAGYSLSKNAAAYQKTCVLYRYNIESNEFQEIACEEGFYDYYVQMNENGTIDISGTGFEKTDTTMLAVDDKGNLYVWEMIRGTLVKVNQTDWSRELIYDNEDYGRAYFNGENIVMDNLDSMHKQDGQRKLILWNPDTEEMDEIIMSKNNRGSVFCYGGTNGYLIMVGDVSKIPGFEDDDRRYAFLCYNMETKEYRIIHEITLAVFSCL